MNPWIAGILYSSHIVALDLFCCHCGRSSYLRGIRFLQLCPVIQRSLNKADHCRCWEMTRQKSNSRIKPSVKFWLLTPTQNQMLRLTMLNMILRRRRRRTMTTTTTTLSRSRNRLQQVMMDYQPRDRLKEGTQIFILLSVQQEVWKKVRLHTSTKTAHHCLCWCCFSQKFFICWWDRPMYTTSNT